MSGIELAELDADIAELQAEHARLVDERAAMLKRPRRASAIGALRLGAAIAVLDDAIGRGKRLVLLQHQAPLLEAHDDMDPSSYER